MARTDKSPEIPGPGPETIRFALLGSFQIWRGAEQIQIGAHKQRLLLATLLCRPNTVMSADHLVEAIWEEEPPRTVRKNLQAYVCALRKLVGERLTSTGYGYCIRCGPADLDLVGFESAAARGRDAARSGEIAVAASELAGALALWRGPFLADVPHTRFLAAMAARLASRRLLACEDWADAALALGQYRQVLDLTDHVADKHPERERLVAAKLIALAQCGRRQEALAYYEITRVALARDLGLDPSPRLRELFRELLAGDVVTGGGAAPAARTPVPAGARGERRGPARSRRGDNQIPRDLPDFTGREREIGALVESLAAGGQGSGAALVTGPVAAGKTALAVHVAHLVSSRFPDGQLFLPMRDQRRRQRSGAELLADLTATLGLAIGDTGAPGAASAWRAWLAGRQLLVVLDDALDESPVRALMPGPGASRIVVSSRYRLSGIESATRVEVGELSQLEATELTARIAGFSAVISGMDQIMAAFDHYGRLPLTVRVLASRLRDRTAVLPSAGDPLDQLARGDLDLRHRYREHLRDLPAAVRRALASAITRIPVSAAFGDGPRSGAALVAELAADPEAAASRAIDALIEAHLLLPADDEVVAHGERYLMPSLACACVRSLLAG